MSKSLLVFAGSGNPHHEDYKGGYDLIVDGATRHGYNEIKVVDWPGQRSAEDDEAELTFEGAVKRAVSALAEYEERGVAFSLVARSFGSIVAAKILAGHQIANMDRLILWAPPPYSVMWRLFQRDYLSARKAMKKKGTFLDREFFSSLEPFEENFTSLKGKVVIATGTADEYCTPTFKEYLKCLAPNDQNAVQFDFREVKDAKHEVDYNNAPLAVQQDYIEALFSQ